MNATRFAIEHDYLVKTLIIGDSGVGKSCLLKQFADDEFVDSFISTIGVDFGIKTVELSNGKIAKLQCWDSAGQERFRNITKSYYRGAHAIILVFDVTDMTSFQNTSKWLSEARENASEDAQILLVANKVDLKESRIVSSEETLELAKQLNVPVIETSAKNATNVVRAFTVAATEAVHKMASKLTPQTKEKAIGKTVPLTSSSSDDPATMKCCQIL